MNLYVDGDHPNPKHILSTYCKNSRFFFHTIYYYARKERDVIYIYNNIAPEGCLHFFTTETR